MKILPAILVISLVVLAIACGKDKFETKPRLEIKDYNSKEIEPNQGLKIRISYFDKEGDIDDAPMIAIRQRLNMLPPNPLQDLADTFRTQLPEFPAKDNGEITFELPYASLTEDLNENDTIVFRFAVTDRAGNNSDTITTDQIVIKKQ